MCDSVGQCKEADIYGFFVEFSKKETRMLTRWGRIGVPTRERVLRVLRKTRGKEAVAVGVKNGSFPKID